jgi:serine/threonine protein kinase
MTPNTIDLRQANLSPRFKAADIRFGKEEIEMLHRLRHCSISFYLAGFITPDNLKASVYVEFCDRGSLDNLIKAYGEKRINARKDSEKPEIPERFIWHVFLSLCDAMAYLLGGRSYSSMENKDYTKLRSWIPILHRDMKPDNVLIRSRGTVGTGRYPYCVLSDFGLACEDWAPGHAKENRHQKARSKLGTKHFYAPELLYDPYPKTQKERQFFPDGQKHTDKSDLYSLGLIIYNLAECPPTMRNGRPANIIATHIPWGKNPPGVEESDFLEGTLSRKYPLDIRATKHNTEYTRQLRDAVLLCTRWDPKKRPDAIKMVEMLKGFMEQSGFMSHIPKGNDHEQLPNWATRVHDYHSKPPIVGKYDT